MRGQWLHNVLAAHAVWVLGVLGCMVYTERRFQLGGLITDIDVWGIHPVTGVACAIEVESSARSALRNWAKVHIVPCDAYVVLVASAALRDEVRRAIRGAGVSAFSGPLISTPGTLVKRLTFVFHRRLQPPEINKQTGGLGS